MNKNWIFILPFLVMNGTINSCSNPNYSASSKQKIAEVDTVIYTEYSHLENQYTEFSSPKAINRITQIENEYFRNYESGFSQYYGTVWREHVESVSNENSQKNLYHEYKTAFKAKGDSMHCTIYAVEALKSGMGNAFEELETKHRAIWKNREHAGWSIGYLLVRDFGWKAYLIIDKESNEFDQCLRAYRRNAEYPVWKQPNIPLDAMYIRGENDFLIDSILNENEFGWGFSHQGIHTWITRFAELKECNWAGAPGKKYEVWSKPLFLKTPFEEYHDYASHVVVFPPKNQPKNEK